MIQNNKPNGDVEQSKTYDGESHDGTRAESNLKTSIETLARSIGSTGRSVGSGLHAEESCKTREESSRKECKRNPRVLHVQAIGHEGKQSAEHHKDNAYDLVLLLQVGHCSVTHIECDLFHTWRTFVGCHHLAEENIRHTQCHDRCDGHEPEYCGNVHVDCCFKGLLI